MLQIYKDRNMTLIGTARDKQKNLIDLTGSILYFTVKLSAEDDESLIEKDTTVVTEMEIDADQINNKGKYYIYMVPDDSHLLRAGIFEFDILLVTASGERYPLHPNDKLEFLQPVTIRPIPAP